MCVSMLKFSCRIFTFQRANVSSILLGFNTGSCGEVLLHTSYCAFGVGIYKTLQCHMQLEWS